MERFSGWLVMAVAWTASSACGSPSPEDRQEQALRDVKDTVRSELATLEAAVLGLREAAPDPDADGWSVPTDAAAVDAMRVQWKKARDAYEHVEGAIAVLFPELDIAVDERYDGFLSGARDDLLFDGEGVTGMHAVERILWSDSVPPYIREFEEGIPGYLAASFPRTESEARAFRDELLARLARDVGEMRVQFEPLALDTAAAFRGVIGSMEEQLEKATLAATGEEESRYAQYTLADMRANVEGGAKVFAHFRPWLRAVGGADEEQAILAGLDRLRAAYGEVSGDGLPPVPATFSAIEPTAADLQTPFGRIFEVVAREADPERTGSLVEQMLRAADKLGIPQLP